MNAEIVSALEDAFPEGLGIGEFLELHLSKIVKSQSPKERENLIIAANKAAEAASSPWRARASDSDGGFSVEAYLVDGKEGAAIVTVREADIQGREK